jgi:hypothetical protein
MSNRIDTRILLGSKRYQTAINTDLTINVGLDNQQKEIDEFDRNERISLAQVYDDERQASGIFRPTAEIDLIYYNAYSGTTGTPNYPPFTNNLFYINSENSFYTSSWSGYPTYNEFEFIRTDTSVAGYTTPSGSTPPHIYFQNSLASKYNWGQYASYAYSNDYSKTLQYYDMNSNIHTWYSGDGIPFTIQNPYISSGQNLISFICPVEHNLSVGEYVQIIIQGWSGLSGQTTFQVYSLGQEGFNSDNYIFNIVDFGIPPSTFSNQAVGTFKRIIDITNSADTMSKYYVRQHKILTNSDDAILTRAGFEKNAFQSGVQYNYSSLTPDNVARISQKEGNQSYLLSFSKDIDISLLLDNLNRPLSKLFITIVNKGYFGWFNKPLNIFSPGFPSLRQGWGYNITKDVSPYWAVTNYTVNKSDVATASYTNLGFTFYYNVDLQVGDIIDGDFCEFNQYEQLERVVSNYYHKFCYNDFLFKDNSVLQNPVNALNPDGFYYTPHFPITIKVFSDYIEEGTVNNTVGVPDYAFYSQSTGQLIWRDLYTYGFIDPNGLGVNFPFLNGAHYPSTKIIFRIQPEGNVVQSIYQIADPIKDECE